MDHERSIRVDISGFLSRRISLAALERRVNASSQEIFHKNDRDAIKLLAAVNLLVSEHHDAIVGEAELRDGLLSLLNNVDATLDVVVSEEYAPFVSHETVNPWLPPWTVQVQLA
jgi:hypothetical protein